MARERFRTFSVRLPEVVFRKLAEIARKERRAVGPQILTMVDERLVELEREEEARKGRA